MAHGSQRRVAVFGGGPAGMTVAHELAERGFQVDLFERHDVLGGKVRSFTHPDTGIGGRPDLPGSMGGHFFMPCYPSLGDTLGRIPTGSGRSVLDHLTAGPAGVGITLAWGDVVARIQLPSQAGLFSPKALLKRVTASLKVLRMLTPTDVSILASKIVALLTSGEKRQWGQLEHLPFGEYLHAHRLSPAARTVVDLPGYLGMANAEGANTRAVARLLGLVVNQLRGRPGPGFRHVLSILDGPETETWFDPWARHLQSLGTRFHLGQTVTGLDYDGGRITGATVRDQAGKQSRVEADWYVLAVPPDKAAALMNPDLVAADPQLSRIERLRSIQGASIQFLLHHKAPELRTLFTTFTAPWQTGNEVLTSAWRQDLTQCGDGKASEYVSIQLTDASWRHLPGMLYGKPGKDCSDRELIDEVLAQLRHHLPGGKEIFADSNVHSWYLFPGMHGGGTAPWTIDEPLFAASPSCWQNQPEPITDIPNLFLAGSYTRNIITGDTMDGANESGKRAANRVLDASGAHEPPVTIATFTAPRELKILRDLDDRRYARGRANAFDVIAPTRP